jgi:cell division protease FtsH
MGHALVSLALPGMDAVHKVSIIPRGIGALGYTIQRPTEDRFLMTESELRDKIAVLMGGRAAEQLVFGHLSTGAADDLARATDIARSMVARYGMDAELGGVSYNTERSSFLGDRPPGYLERNYSEATANAMDTAVRTVLREVLQQALEILTDNRDILERAASRLLEVETLDEAALRDLTQDLRKGAAGKAKVAMNG